MRLLRPRMIAELEPQALKGSQFRSGSEAGESPQAS